MSCYTTPSLTQTLFISAQSRTQASPLQSPTCTHTTHSRYAQRPSRTRAASFRTTTPALQPGPRRTTGSSARPSTTPIHQPISCKGSSKVPCRTCPSGRRQCARTSARKATATTRDCMLESYYKRLRGEEEDEEELRRI